MEKEQVKYANAEEALDSQIALDTNINNIFAIPTEELLGNQQQQDGQLTPEQQQYLYQQQQYMQQQQMQPQQQMPQLTAEDRYRYWQSQYDKLKNEVTPYNDIIEELKRNPDRVNQIRSVIYSQQQDVKQEQEPEVRSIVDELHETFYSLGAPPEPPQRPYNFNMTDAINDPNSESAKYYMQFLEWQQKVSNFNNTRVAHLFNIVANREEARERAERERAMLEAQRAAEAKKMQEIRNALKKDYKMTEDEADDFMSFIYSPNVTMDDLVNFYKSKQSINQQQQKSAQQGSHQQRATVQQMPQSIAVSPGSQTPEATLEQLFNDAFSSTANNWVSLATKKGG